MITLGLNSQQLLLVRTLFEDANPISGPGSVYHPDWDLLIVHGQYDPADFDPNLFVVAFGGLFIDFAPARQDTSDGSYVARSRSSASVRLAIPPEVPGDLADLAASDLIPLLRAEHSHQGLEVLHVLDAKQVGPAKPMLSGLPLVVGSDGAWYAAELPRAGGKGRIVTLPAEAALIPWIVACVNRWHDVDPARFPFRVGGWDGLPINWFTREEQRAAESWLEAAERVTKAEADRDGAATALIDAGKSAAGGIRRLLTAQSADLSAAVREALADLGFSVRDMDTVWPAKDFREDLRVSSPDDRDWIAIVEVKGYSKSLGKVGDLLTLGRFANRFRNDEKHDPSARWYVLNHDFDIEPDDREPILKGNDGDLRTFGEEGGLAIDTADLMRLWLSVERGRMTPSEARCNLTTATGRFSFPWPPATDGDKSA